MTTQHKQLSALQLESANQNYLVITGAQYHWGLGTLHFPSCFLGSCRGLIRDRWGRLPSMVHQAGTLSTKENRRTLLKPVSLLTAISKITMAPFVPWHLLLTRRPAGCTGKLGTHLVTRSTMPVVSQPISYHHVILRVWWGPWHLHRGDRTCKGEDNTF